MNVLDDNGKEVKVGDYVKDYYNVADGDNSKGDRCDYVKIEDQLTLGEIVGTSDSLNRHLIKISKNDFLKGEIDYLEFKVDELEKENDKLKKHILNNQSQSNNQFRTDLEKW